MADKRISELNPLSSADLDAASDVLAVADLSASETKKLTPTALIVGSVGVVPDGTIPGSKIEPDSITSLELAPDSVTDVELADNAADTGVIQNRAVTQEKLADGAVGTDQLADGAVNTDKLAEGAVGAAQIADRSIPAIKLEQNTLTAEEIAPNAIGASELADNAVDTPAVATDALATRHYQNASVTNEKLADGIDGGKLRTAACRVPSLNLTPLMVVPLMRCRWTSCRTLQLTLSWLVLRLVFLLHLAIASLFRMISDCNAERQGWRQRASCWRA